MGIAASHIGPDGDGCRTEHLSERHRHLGAHPDPTAEPASGDKPALPSPTRPGFSVRPGKGIFAMRRYRRAFRRGLIAFAQGKPEIALQEMEQASLKGGAERASVQLFLALCLIDLGRLPEAASRLRALVASGAPLPDRLMHTNLSGGVLEAHVTPNVTAHTSLDRIGAALLLAEVLERTHRPSEAIELLEMLGAGPGLWSSRSVSRTSTWPRERGRMSSG